MNFKKKAKRIKGLEEKMRQPIKKRCPRCDGTGTIEEITIDRADDFKDTPVVTYKGKKCKLGIEFEQDNTCQIYFEDTNEVDVVDRGLVEEVK